MGSLGPERVKGLGQGDVKGEVGSGKGSHGPAIGSHGRFGEGAACAEERPS